MKHSLRKITLPALALTALLALSACGGAADTAGSPTSGTSTSATAGGADSQSPSAGMHNDADAAFATGMVPHHQQAVEMAGLAATRASSPEVKDLAKRISAAQGPEITQMTGWLTEWGQAMPDHSGMAGMDDAPSGGMMSGQDMQQLEKSTGKQFDEAFLTGMLAHHRGAVDMAKIEVMDGSDAAAKELAQAVVTGQSKEITEIEALLAQLKG